MVAKKALRRERRFASFTFVISTTDLSFNIYPRIHTLSSMYLDDDDDKEDQILQRNSHTLQVGSL